MTKLRVKLKPKIWAPVPPNLHAIDRRRVDPDVVHECEKTLIEAIGGKLVGVVTIKICFDGKTSYGWAGLNNRNVAHAISELGQAELDLSVMCLYRDPESFLSSWITGGIE